MMRSSLTCHTTRNGRRFMLGLLAGLLGLTSGCGSGSSSSSTPIVSASDSRFRVRNVRDLGTVDAYVVAQTSPGTFTQNPGNTDITGLSPTFAGVAAGSASTFRITAPATYEFIVTP